MLNEFEAKQKIVQYAASMFNRGLTSGASANMSVRIDQGWVITPTNTCFGFLDEARLAVVDHDGNLISGDKPSKEFLLHKVIYEKRPEDQCVIHLHSTYATALSCLPCDDIFNSVPTYTPYLTMRLGPIATIPYFSPGDGQLVDAVSDVAAKHPGVLMANHGPIVSAKSVEDALYGMEELEESCKIALLLRSENANKLTAQEIETLATRFKK